MFETLTIENEHETDLKADNTAEIEGKIHECRVLHLMNLQTVDNTDLDHLLSRQEIPDAEQMTITNAILETDNTVRDHKRIVGIDPDKPDTMINQIIHGNKRTEISCNGGTSKFTQEVFRKDQGNPRYVDHPQEPTYRQRAPWRQHQTLTLQN